VLAYIARRLTWAVVLCLALTLVTFVLFYVIPQNSVRLRGSGATDIEKWSKLHGSVLTQYGEWLWRLAHGSLDRSFYSRQPVTTIITNAAPITLSLTIGAAVVWMLIALPLGVCSAMRPRSLIDRAGMTLVLVGLSVHPVWLGLMLSYVFGYRLDLAPKGGYCDMFGPETSCGGPVQWAFHLLLPWITFAAVFAALYTRMIRASVTETLQEDYVKQARAKGLSEWQAMRSHVLPNALVPVVAMLAMDIGRLALPTALFVETAFGLPGIGRIFYQAIQRNDLPVLAGIIVVSCVAVVLLNLVADLLFAVLDPRVRAQPEPVPV
jgi:peptide/nickel transport system permease protein